LFQELVCPQYFIQTDLTKIILTPALLHWYYEEEFVLVFLLPIWILSKGILWVKAVLLQGLLIIKRALENVNANTNKV